MAFYTGYFDESESEVGPFFVFGGLVLDVEDPKEFEREWRTAIDPLPVLHTSPFLAGGKGFEHWNSNGLSWKQERLKKAARVNCEVCLLDLRYCSKHGRVSCH